jgi:hypothetical protein
MMTTRAGLLPGAALLRLDAMVFLDQQRHSVLAQPQS